MALAGCRTVAEIDRELIAATPDGVHRGARMTGPAIRLTRFRRCPATTSTRTRTARTGRSPSDDARGLARPHGRRAHRPRHVRRAGGGRGGGGGPRLEFVPIEFSAEYDGASLHVLGYWVDPDDSAIDAELTRLTATRLRRGELIVEKLRELGFDVSIDRVREIADGGAIARPHIAQAMVEAGVVADEKEAFERYISDEEAYVPKHALIRSGRSPDR